MCAPEEKDPFRCAPWIAAALILAPIALVPLTGSTFGQRCKAAGFRGPWLEVCVERMAKGMSISEIADKAEVENP